MPESSRIWGLRREPADRMISLEALMVWREPSLLVHWTPVAVTSLFDFWRTIFSTNASVRTRKFGRCATSAE